MKAFLTLAVIIATLASTTSAHASWTATLLAPTTATQSYVNGIEGATVVGNVQIGATTAEGHWLTPASPFVGLGTFGVEGIGGGLLVGSGFVGGVAGAAYYSLATRTFTSVHPGPPFVGSTLHGASPNTQVGLVNAFGTSTAALWRGTACASCHPTLLAGDRHMRMASTYSVGGHLCIPNPVLGAATVTNSRPRFWPPAISRARRSQGSPLRTA